MELSKINFIIKAVDELNDLNISLFDSIYIKLSQYLGCNIYD